MPPLVGLLYSFVVVRLLSESTCLDFRSFVGVRLLSATTRLNLYSVVDVHFFVGSDGS